MSTEGSAPTEQEWRALYRAADAFKQVAPWQWMYDDDMFAVEDPETHEIGYISIMGNLGEHLALGLYLGAEGLRALEAIRQQIVEGPGALFVQKCLMASFEDRDTLSKEERDQIKALGLKYRGRQAWPQFLDYEPGYGPWTVSGPQARFLTVALEQSCEVADRYRSDNSVLDGPDDQILLRVLKDGAWQDRWHTPDMDVPDEPIPAVDEQALQRIRAAMLPQRGDWESGTFYTLSQVQEERDQRPFFVRLLLTVEPTTQTIMPPEMGHPAHWRAQYQQNMLSTIEKVGVIPRSIIVIDPELSDLLVPIADALNITVMVVDEAPVLEMIADQIASMFENLM